MLQLFFSPLAHPLPEAKAFLLFIDPVHRQTWEGSIIPVKFRECDCPVSALLRPAGIVDYRNGNREVQRFQILDVIPICFFMFQYSHMRFVLSVRYPCTLTNILLGSHIHDPTVYSVFGNSQVWCVQDIFVISPFLIRCIEYHTVISGAGFMPGEGTKQDSTLLAITGVFPTK